MAAPSYSSDSKFDPRSPSVGDKPRGSFEGAPIAIGVRAMEPAPEARRQGGAFAMAYPSMQTMTTGPVPPTPRVDDAVMKALDELDFEDVDEDVLEEVEYTRGRGGSTGAEGKRADASTTKMAFTERPPMVPPHSFVTSSRADRPEEASRLDRYTIVRNKDGKNTFKPVYYMFEESPTGSLRLALGCKKQMARSPVYHFFNLEKGDPKTVLAKGTDYYVGKLRGDGNKFTLYGPGVARKKLPTPLTPDAVRSMEPELCGAVFEPRSSFVPASTPRVMNALVTRRGYEHRPEDPDDALVGMVETEGRDLRDTLFLPNKVPEKVDGVHRLYYKGRCRLASIKNFQLTLPGKPDVIALQFGKVTENKYILDFMSDHVPPLQAFALAMTQFSV